MPEIAPTTPFYGYENTPGWNVIWGPTTPWDAAAMILPWELYTTYGDTRVLAHGVVGPQITFQPGVFS